MQATKQNGAVRARFTNDQKLRQLMLMLEGRKRWLTDGTYQFEATPANLEAFRFLYPDAELQELDTPVDEKLFCVTRPPFTMATKPYDHQRRALAAAATRRHFALFMEQGTGKTKVAIDHAASLWCEGKIDQVLVVTKKGIHRQWAEEQLPLHLHISIPNEKWLWPIKGNGWQPSRDLTTMNWFFINIDALNTKPGFFACDKFVRAGRTLMIVDESQIIKTHSAKRTKACYALGAMANRRMILTGTPIAKDLSDEWSQFKFLDETVLGHRYLTSFRAAYCVMGGFENRQVVSHKNIDEFIRRTGEASFRVTKEDELDLPPKVYVKHSFDMEDEQLKLYKEMKKNLAVELAGERLTVANGAAALTKLHQIACGFFYDGEKTHEFSNARLNAMLDIIEGREGRGVIWARFTHDIERIADVLGPTCATYYGDTTNAERTRALEDFHSGKIRWLVANPAAGGTGLNLQGEDVRTVIYYSNSFNALDRWQSEDRTHRIGMGQSITYFDIVANKSIDGLILNNLKRKKSISDIALGEIKEFLAE